MDCFCLNNRHTASQEWIIATDALGNLQALPDGDRQHLPPEVQTELAWFEMGSHHKRQIEAAELYLFYLQVLEQLPEAPGLNDPIYLYGTLFGPYPSASPAAGIEGQLTITRADLLEGLLLGADFAFRYAGSGGDPSRCFHLTLPADTEDAIKRGQGVVIAYPLLPPELIVNDVANELFACRLLYDTMSALKADAEEENIHHPLKQTTLPVPNRALLEQQLQTEGYEIKGDKAVRKSNRDGEPAGLLAKVFGALLSESLKLPPEGQPEDFLQLAKLTLQALPGWPTARSVALKNLIKPASPIAARTAITPPPPHVQTFASRPKLPPRATNEPPAWVKDFAATHQRPNSEKPRLTSHSTNDTNSPEWMKDFDEPAIPSAIQNETNTSDKSPHNPVNKNPQPDWMQDFD
ncbi:MAG TPA: hypothetical protein PLQ88_18560 [Blastocatellia bacterium]|nr:hypothetical protein [Blastocatellia bacterium]